MKGQQGNGIETGIIVGREPKDKMKIATLNVGTLNGKDDKLANAMEKHSLDVLCLQETRETSSGDKEICNKYKIYYSGGDRKTNGVAVCVKKKWQGGIDVIRVMRISDRLMAIKLLAQNRVFNIFSVYAPQRGKKKDEKEAFWEKLRQKTDAISLDEELIVAGDFNGHVGMDREGFDMWHGGNSKGTQNGEGKMILEFAREQDLALVNTFFGNSNLCTYESGGQTTVIDYLTIRRDSMGMVDDCRVTSEKSLASKHKLVVMDLTLKWKKNTINWWKLNTSEGEELIKWLKWLSEEQCATSWDGTYQKIMYFAMNILGKTGLDNFLNNESWWWDEDVQKAIQNEKLPKNISVIASNRQTISNNVSFTRSIKSAEGQILSADEDIQRRWKDYFSTLLNSENNIDITKREEVRVEIEAITESEVEAQIGSMEFSKVRDLNDIPIMLVKKLGEIGIKWSMSCLQDAITNGIPNEWKQRKITPKLKGNRDALECSNYYGVNASRDLLALLEGILKTRLQKIVKINERSTTESVFCIRMFQERHREYNRPLHMVVIKLGNACDTALSEGIWNCLRRRNVPEKYITAIKDMYSNCTARVVTSVGETEEFCIKPTLPRGSVLSNLILAIVLNVISDDLNEQFPWAMVHGYSIVLSAVEVKSLEERLENFREKLLTFAGLALHEMEIEYLSPSSTQDSITLQSDVDEQAFIIPSCTSFRFLKTTIQNERGCKKEVERRISKAWIKWHKMRDILLNDGFPIMAKTCIYEKFIRPKLLYNCETCPIKALERKKIESCEIKMLRYFQNKDARKNETDDSI